MMILEPRSSNLGGRSAVTNSRLDCFDALAAGRQDRVDELVIGVLVAAIDELGDAVMAVRALVVDAREVERAERIMGGTDQVQAGRPTRPRQRIMQIGGLEG